MAGVREAPAGEAALVALRAQPPLAAVSQWSARLGRFRAAKFCLGIGWMAEWGQQIGEAGTGIPIETRLLLQTDSTTLTECLRSTDPGHGSGAEMGGHGPEWERGPA